MKALLLLSFIVFAWPALAQVAHQELQETVRAEVLEIVEEYERDIMGTGATTTVQQLRIEIKSGTRAGEVVALENDLVVLRVGQAIFVNRLIGIDGVEYFTFKDIERRTQMAVLGALLLAAIICFAGWQGVRAVLSLGLSILAILFLLVPALLQGYDPALASFGIATVVLAVIIFITHGVSARVIIAYFGTMAAVAVTCLLAWWSVAWLGLTGFSADASVYLNFAMGGQLDLAGLLLGSIIIGLLGILDDVAITQASVVEALKAANQGLRWRELYQRSIRVGRDHVGSLVNTLALAYVGAALPVVLLFARSDATFLAAINQEVIAAEYVRIVVGSLGLVLAVPLTTLIAAWYFGPRHVDKQVAECHHGHHHHG